MGEWIFYLLSSLAGDQIRRDERTKSPRNASNLEYVGCVYFNIYQSVI